MYEKTNKRERKEGRRGQSHNEKEPIKLALDVSSHFARENQNLPKFLLVLYSIGTRFFKVKGKIYSLGLKLNNDSKSCLGTPSAF